MTNIHDITENIHDPVREQWIKDNMPNHHPCGNTAPRTLGSYDRFDIANFFVVAAFALLVSSALYLLATTYVDGRIERALDAVEMGE